MPNLDEIQNTIRSKAMVSEHYTWYVQAIFEWYAASIFISVQNRIYSRRCFW